MIDYTVQRRDEFRFVDEGPVNGSPPVVLLHGMLGATENWAATVAALSKEGHRVLAPVLPVYDLPESETSVRGLMHYTGRFIRTVGLRRPVLVGNSLGGQVTLLYALDNADDLTALVLTGASGVHEVALGESTPRRFDREYVKERAALTFYDPRHASESLVNDVMAIVADRGRLKRLIRMARSARREKVETGLPRISIPTLLIWGAEDRLTPPDVARRFEQQMPQARLEIISSCGHAPMIERPGRFNQLLLDFLKTIARSGDSRAKLEAPLPSSR